MPYGRERTPLFWTHDGFAVKQSQIQAAVAAVDQTTEDRLLNTDPDALTQYFVSQFSVEVPKLDHENISAAEHERQVEVWNHFEGRAVLVSGVAFDFEIPFSGDPKIFSIRPNTYDTAPPHADIVGNTVRFSVSGRELTADAVKNALHETTKSIEKYLSWHEAFWNDLGANVSREVRSRINERRERLMKQKGVAAGLASIGVKLREKPTDPRTYVPAAVKQKLTPQMPPMRAAAKPEPTLDSDQYATILGLLRDAGRSIEQSSSRARELNEEALRDMFLVPLNSHYGAATGEAFNFNGKTDIVIRHEGKNLFVAECKFWTGDKQFMEAIDQLLGYLTWRDTKTVLIVFSRNTGFSAVVQKLEKLPATHVSFVAGPTKLDESSFQFTFKLPRDSDRKIKLTVMGFDLGSSTQPRVRST
jgi:hypothetical protein